MQSLRRIIDFVERHTGETYDWDACRAIMEKHNDEVRNEQEKWNFMATPYTAAALAVPNTVPYRSTTRSPAAGIPRS